MINVSLHYDTEGWAYHRRCQALAKYCPSDFRVSFGRGSRHDRRDPCHLALQLCYSHVRDLRKSYRQAGQSPLIVAGLNVGYTDRNMQWLAGAIRDANHVVINSREMYERAGRPAKCSWISNGVDREVFRMIAPIATRPRRVLWTGSVFHRKLKGYDEILIPLAKRLWRDGIECDFRLVDSHGGPSRRTAEEMAVWYQTGAVYVVASATEGTPNPALEAAACGCVICSTRVGNMPELVEDGINGRLVDRDPDAIYHALVECLDRYAEMQPRMEAAIAGWDWRIRAGEYWELFRRLVGRTL